ncbi:MAG: formyltetrahydrofolate deformylase [Gammaproteobacteria bacterium]|nr:formyltetrahydrofolate deformylase [Gammaproteobacteria bacterium]TVQ45203.1 MAG: formyltetrahydrofolate deformylase [Gammaproteobacteria bacterium]
MTALTHGHILTLSCPDRVGIVHAVSGFLAERGCNILDSAQFGDPDSGQFFMRVHFSAGDTASGDAAAQAFQPVADSFAMDWKIVADAHRPRTLIMVSRQDHCLRELLYRYGNGSLPMTPVAVISNHRDSYRLVAGYDIPFHHLPVSAETREDQEAALLRLIGEYAAELVVLARYMQILSDGLCRQLAGRCINIHHSFLPSFKGARPYHQAYAHGVKLIGATAHYVTPQLDEGPIIEQDVTRVDHTLDADALVERGRDIERMVLARAVRAHVQRRVLLNGNRTVVFP